jgi:glycosidase
MAIPSSGIRLEATARHRLDLGGPARLSEPPTARAVAHRLSTEPGRANARPVLAGDVLALGLLDEVSRLVIARYLELVDATAFERAAAAARDGVGAPAERTTLDAYGAGFPASTADVGGETDGDALAEVLLTWLANANPAIGPLRTLVDDRPMAAGPGVRYADLVGATGRYFAAAPRFGPDGQDLITLLRAPARAAPGSLTAQLEWIRDRWANLLGEAGSALLGRLVVGLGVIAEERSRLGLIGAAAGGGGGLGGLVGIGPGDDALLDAEPERYSTDVAWMPELVLIAKSTHVWLDQLSRTYGREIRTLDAIPDEELDSLARHGVTGLWLIGLWERSRASQEIKRRRGNTDALASAYALHDYVIATDLGGPRAAQMLGDRAMARGIRLASDMVPNHMGIDARWVVEHPDWFLSLPYSPFPAYSFGGPDLSWDDRVAIVLEDHYWDGTDAAVVFKRVDRASGSERYVYHGNDGTSFPWNDTAQLDYLRADVREAVIQTILHVARQFPVIRFDAAMVLAKRHIERLWHPLPGRGGAIPSRAEFALTKREFDAAIPIEFWREVVDRVAAEAPGTLLLAEAFWLMEGYFVRTLGMHRVYNSAFMNLLRDEENGTYRRVMRDTLEFDPQILGRFVNFMSNPDEKTAVEQFGTGDKHFGVATLMATLPGLPMLGHGQLEGFRERYGMEFSRAAWDERIDEGMLARYEREIVPLMQRRGIFAGSGDFLLYDVIGDDGAVREDAYAYSNVGPGGERSLVVYHNRYASTSGRIRESVPFSAADPASGERSLRRRSLADGLGVWLGAPEEPALDGLFVRARSAITGVEHLWRARDIAAGGLWLELGAYEYRVYLDWASVRDADGRWSRLHDRLGGHGVPSLDDALRDLELAPVHEAFGRLLGGHGPGTGADAFDLVRAVREATGARRGAPDAKVAEAISTGLAAVEALKVEDPTTAVALRTRAIAEPLGRLGDADDSRATARAWFTELRLGPALVRSLGDRPDGPAGSKRPDPEAAAHRTWLLLRLARPGLLPTSTSAPGHEVATAWVADPDVSAYLDVHASDGIRWLNAERLDELADWATTLDRLDGGTGDGGEGAGARAGGGSRASAAAIATIRRAAAAAGYRVDEWLASLAPDEDLRPAGRSSRKTATAAATTRTSAKRRQPAARPSKRRDP